MRCACGEPLRPIVRSEITLDVCDACGRTWFDQGEIEQLLEAPSGQQMFVLWLEPRVVHSEGPTCPRCTLNTGVRRLRRCNNIEVELCQAHGAFLQRGDLTKIHAALLELHQEKSALRRPSKADGTLEVSATVVEVVIELIATILI